MPVVATSPVPIGSELQEECTFCIVVKNTFIHVDVQEPRQPRLRHCISDSALLARLCVAGSPAASPMAFGQPDSRRSDPMLATLDETGSESSQEKRTTVMLRNVPYWLSRDQLKGLLDSFGFEHRYRLLYLPMDWSSRQSIGYAFIDMSNPEAALECFGTFDGFTGWPDKSSKVCQVQWSNVQGIDANVRHYRNSPVMNRAVPESWKPLIFVDGEPAKFPRPTKKIRGSCPRA